MSTKNENNARPAKGGSKALWGIVAFYLLIAFEIVYMAGPFAVYFYGVYNPILNFFNSLPALAGLNAFFFPHIVQDTTSGFFGASGTIGVALAVAGFAAFLFGACQIYYSKFAKKGAVTGGIYNHIRHPQYVSFSVCGFGLLLMWPRVINLLMFVTMLFVYYLLAKAEERECEAKFGQPYIDYKNRTRMFFPFKLPKPPSLPKTRGKRALVLIAMYIAAICISYDIAQHSTEHAVDSLYAIYTEDTATVSLDEIDAATLEQVVQIAKSDASAAAMLAKTQETRFINYVMPTQWLAAELPMNGLENTRAHSAPAEYDATKYKVIFTAVQCRGDAIGREILTSVGQREALAEVWVDLDALSVTKVLEIPQEYKYRGVPVAVY